MHGVTVLYLEQSDLNHEAVSQWLASENAKSWKILAHHERQPQPWMLLSRDAPMAK